MMKSSTHDFYRDTFINDNNDSNATMIQSAWRGRKARRTLKLQTVCAINIQRIFRGMRARRLYSSCIESAIERKHFKNEQSRRLRKIHAQEKNLRLFSTISSEQYLNFERIRRNRAARKIQSIWRNATNASVGQQIYKATEVLRISRRIRDRPGFSKIPTMSKPIIEPDVSKSNNINSESSDEKKRLKDVLSKSEANFKYNESSTKNKLHSEEYVDQDAALGFTLLYQKIRTQALEKQESLQKMSYNNFKVFGSSYHDMLRQRRKLEDIMEDQEQRRLFSLAEKEDREKSLQGLKNLMADIKALPTLEDAAMAISFQDSQHISPIEEKTRQWIYEGINVAKYSKDMLDSALNSHIQTTQQLIGSSKSWDRFLNPVSLAGVERASIEGSNSPTSLSKQIRMRRSSVFDDSHKEDSLRWISFATSGDNFKKNPGRYAQLRARALQSIVDPQGPFKKAEIGLNSEKKTIEHRREKLEYCIASKIRLEYFRKTGRRFVSMTKKDKIRSRFLAVVRIQSIIRGYLCRKKLTSLRLQRRIGIALQSLLQEVAQINVSSSSRYKQNLCVQEEKAIFDSLGISSFAQREKIPGTSFTPHSMIIKSKNLVATPLQETSSIRLLSGNSDLNTTVAPIIALNSASFSPMEAEINKSALTGGWGLRESSLAGFTPTGFDKNSIMNTDISAISLLGFTPHAMETAEPKYGGKNSYIASTMKSSSTVLRSTKLADSYQSDNELGLYNKNLRQGGQSTGQRVQFAMSPENISNDSPIKPTMESYAVISTPQSLQKKDNFINNGLSPFLEIPLDGYISSPSTHGNADSLSMSLSERFNQVENSPDHTKVKI